LLAFVVLQPTSWQPVSFDPICHIHAMLMHAQLHKLKKWSLQSKILLQHKVHPSSTQPLGVHALSSAGMLHSEVKLIWISLFCLPAQELQRFLLSMEVICACLVILLPF
jgi:hypothetical protein